MHHLGGHAPVLGALRPIPGMVDDGAVAVLKTGATVPAFTAHGLFIAPAGDKAWMPRLRPAELVQPIVVDPEVVRDFVDHRDRHLLDDFLLGLAELQQRGAVDGDGVG